MIRTPLIKNPNTFIIILAILLVVVSIGYFSLLTKTQEQSSVNDLKSRVELLENCTSEYIEIGREIEYCNGARITFHNVQVYQPSPVKLQSGKELSSKNWVAIALDIEVSGKKVKQTIERFRNELIIRPRDTLKLDEYYFPHITSIPDQTAKPDLLNLWHQIDISYINRKIDNYPPGVRGWVTFILKKDDLYLEDKVDDSFAENILLIYDNTSVTIEELLEQLGRSIE